MAKKLDEELVALYVDEYEHKMQGFIGDIFDVVPEKEQKAAVADFTADHIYDCESPGVHIPEIQAAAKLIAAYYCG